MPAKLSKFLLENSRIPPKEIPKKAERVHGDLSDTVETCKEYIKAVQEEAHSSSQWNYIERATKNLKPSGAYCKANFLFNSSIIIKEYF